MRQFPAFFIDIKVCAYLNFIKLAGFVSPVLQTWHVSQHIICIAVNTISYLLSWRSDCSLGPWESLWREQSNVHNISSHAWEKNLMPDKLFITNLSARVALLSRGSWLSLRALKGFFLKKSHYKYKDGLLHLLGRPM